MHFWNRTQWRLFWQSFWVSLIFLGFVSGFLYLSYGQSSQIQEPILSVDLSYSQPLEHSENSRLSETDGCSFSFLGWKKEISSEEMEQISRRLSTLFHRYGILIPARWRAIGMAVEYILAAAKS